MDDNKLNFELLPCPFCGSGEVEPLFFKWEEEWRVICNSCHAYTTFGYSNVSRWNTRPLEDALKAENARLRGFIQGAIDNAADKSNMLAILGDALKGGE